VLCLASASSLFAQSSQTTPAASASPAASPATAAETSGYSEDTSAAASKLGYNSVHVSEPYVALTFDDGPHATLTPKLLDILKARHVKATFFVVGENAIQYPEILKRAVAEGHEIGNHSWNHPNFAKMSEESVRSQVVRTQEAIEKATGIPPKILRPPYGSITEKERHWLHDSLGFKIIMWSVDPLDWKDRNAGTVARRILAGTHPGSIVLSHDIHASTVEAMPNVIDSLLGKGFKFATVSELIAMDQPGATPAPEKSPAAVSKPRKPKKGK
jgi:peptidoglycan/xylan/chitin deacetylase (PgdA/CDA1 family)